MQTDEIIILHFSFVCLEDNMFPNLFSQKTVTIPSSVSILQVWKSLGRFDGIEGESLGAPNYFQKPLEMANLVLQHWFIQYLNII